MRAIDVAAGTRPNPSKTTCVAAVTASACKAESVTLLPVAPPTDFSTNKGSVVSEPAAAHLPAGSLMLTTQASALADRAQVLSRLLDAFAVVSQKVTSWLRRRASLRARCKPCCSDSAVLRMRLLATIDVTSGTTANSSTAPSAIVIASSIIDMPRWPLRISIPNPASTNRPWPPRRL